MSHDNLTWMAKQVCNYLGVTSNDSLVSYLPLSHSAAQMVDVSKLYVLSCSTFGCYQFMIFILN